MTKVYVGWETEEEDALTKNKGVWGGRKGQDVPGSIWELESDSEAPDVGFQTDAEDFWLHKPDVFCLEGDFCGQPWGFKGWISFLSPHSDEHDQVYLDEYVGQ